MLVRDAGVPLPSGEKPGAVAVERGSRWAAGTLAHLGRGAPIELATERPTVIGRDEHGNARGGIRTPFVDVPTSALRGDPVPGSPPLCQSFGSTTPFDAATLASLYPDHESYVEAFTASTEAAVDAGFILRPEADAMIATAEQSTIGTNVG